MAYLLSGSDIGIVYSVLGAVVVLFIAALFVVSEGLDATGVTTWAGQRLIGSVGQSRTRLIVLTMLLVAGLTALISVNGAVAALLPMVVVIALRLGRAPSQLLMPLAFAAHAGSQLALTGSPVNILVSEAADDVSGTGFGFVEFAIVGIPLLVGTIAIVVLFGAKLLPHRVAEVLPPDLSAHALTLVEQYSIPDRVAHFRVLDGSPVIGRVANDLALESGSDVQLLGVQRRGTDGHQHAMLDGPIEAGDIVLFDAGPSALAPLADRLGLDSSVAPPLPGSHAPIVSREYGLVELVVAPRVRTRRPGHLSGHAHGERRDGGARGAAQGPRPGPRAGDARGRRRVAGAGTWESIEANVVDSDVLVVDDPDLVRRQTVAFGARATQAVVVLLAMVVLLATGAVAPAVAGLLAAGAMVVLRVVDVQQAYRAISWTTVVLVGAMIPLSTALQKTGAANELAEALVDLVGDSPYLLLAGLFLLTAVLGQLISNTATALVVIPIAVSAAAEANVSERPLLMGVCAAAAAAFLTPVATPVNLMVMGPGAYRFGDYWKLGGVLLVWFFAVVMVVVPVVWQF